MTDSGVGRLWVAVDANVNPALRGLKALDAQVLKSTHLLNTMGHGSNSTNGVAALQTSLQKTEQSATRTARSVEQMGLKATSASKPFKALEASAYRFSQAFINLRYGNPIGMVAGLAQAGSSLNGALSGIAATSGVVAAGVAGIALAAVAAGAGVAAVTIGLGKYGLDAASDLEMLRIQFEGLLGSAERANNEVNFLLKLGQTSILPTEDLMQVDRLLLAYGVTADSLRQKLVQGMSDFGAATGVPTEKLQDMAYAIGQIQSIGKANAIDFRQMANAGLGTAAITKEIARQQGISVQQAQKLASEGKATADVVLPAVLAVMSKSAGAAEKARNSAHGLWVNLQDIAKTKIGLAFETLLQKVKPLLQWAQDFLQSINFNAIGAAFENLVTVIGNAFGGIDGDAQGTAEWFNTYLPQAINLFGTAIADIIVLFRILYTIGYGAVKAIWGGAEYATTAIWEMAAAANDFLDLIGVVGDEAGQTFRDMANKNIADSRRAYQEAFAQAVSTKDSLAQLFSTPIYIPLGFTSLSTLSDGEKQRQRRGLPPLTTPDAPLPKPDPTGSGAATESKAEKAAKKRWQKWLTDIRQVIDAAKTAFNALHDLTTRFAPGEMSKIEEAFRFGGKDGNFQGNVSSIISTYNDLADSITKVYAVYEKYGKASDRTAATSKRKSLIEGLRKQAQSLVVLARENEAFAKELDNWRTSETDRVQKQIDALDGLYNGFNDANGYAVQGLIEKAQANLTAATQAYDDANTKLQDLISARDDFLKSIRDSARSFVNALEVASETIQQYTRLDSAGSFLLEEKQKNASLKEQMTSRLDILKTWVANVKTLMSRGLDSGLLRDLVSAGPESSGSVVQQLVDGAQQGIAEVNALQQELNSVTSDLQSTTAAAWFNPGISAQQEVVNQLATAKAAAEQSLKDVQAQYNLQLANLQAYQKSVEDGTDANSQRLTSLMQVNDTKAAEIAASIQSKFEWLTDRDHNKKNMYDTGIAVIDGFVKGLESKEELVVATAKRIAGKVRDTVANALDINSPSQVGFELGAYFGEGMALGQVSSLSRVEAASMSLAGAAVSGVDTSRASSRDFSPTVKVYIGDKELTDLVDLRIEASDGAALDYVSSGRRI